ncbi:hypothetical protein IQ250_16810 [Pseudanabaenaceae cyanobacterium LEGE 13415]|nr:hypothetical protein [Pseudanabaenaceae cyanobacterium LEGE 13415]
MKGFQKFLRFCASGTLISFLILCTGCSSTPFLGGGQTPKTELSMQVEPTRDPGIYQVTGSTNLPDQTRLTIQAIRSLRSNSPSESEPSYSILARTEVKVEKGKWQTSLNLLQQDRSESWQKVARSLNLKSEPEKQVRFLVLTDPTENPIEIQQRSAAVGNQGTSVQFTADGRSYLQAEQILAIEPPTATVAASEKPVQTVVKVAVQPINKATEVKSKTDAELPTKAWMR